MIHISCNPMKSWHPQTSILHHDRIQKESKGSNSFPVFQTSSFGFENPSDLVDAFQGKIQAFTYSRQNNPTVQNLCNKLSLLCNGAKGIVFGTGMGAIASTIFALLKNQDEILASKYLFGNTRNLLKSFDRLGVKVKWFDPVTLDNIRDMLSPKQDWFLLKQWQTRRLRFPIFLP